MGCNGNCASCGGCGRCLELTEQELSFLYTLGEVAFLPVARRADDMVPVCLEPELGESGQGSLLLQVLEKKGLITLDYDKPLSQFAYGNYRGLPVRGSMALTARGQRVLELVEYQGLEQA